MSLQKVLVLDGFNKKKGGKNLRRKKMIDEGL